jgi:hypothetical protein
VKPWLQPPPRNQQASQSKATKAATDIAHGLASLATRVLGPAAPIER